ncbi:MAG: hypothetical protein F4X54_12225 [Chloroflexi bacterium]|nr:hypothetical protein [Chloroflexota bacterium]
MAELLKELIDAIQEVRDRANNHPQYFSEGHHAEWRTRIGLIDPVLHALGWDVSDPTLVEIEPQTKSGRPDYALLGSNRKAVIYLEAKNLSVSKPPTDQILNYVVSENMNNPLKIGYCAWTNGNEWEVYDVFNQNSVMELSLKKEDSSKCALKFLGLWRRSLQDGGFDQAVAPLVEVRVEAAREPTAQTQTVSGATTDGTVGIRIGEPGWVELDGDYPTTGHPPPNAIRLPGDEEPKAIRAWTQVPMEVAMWLHKKSLLTREDCRFKVTQQRYLLSPDGKHATGTAFHSPRSLGDTGIWMEASYNPNNLIAYTCALLERFGQDPSQVHLKLS